jgi:hypothetical protein
MLARVDCFARFIFHLKEAAMSVQTIADKFMDLCNQGKHFEVMRNMYSPDMVSVEGTGKQTVGKDAVIHKSEVWQGNNNIEGQDLHGPFFCGDPNAKSGLFAVYTSLTFTPKAGGKRQTHDEVGMYTVKNDVITREEFYYSGAFI